MLGMRLATANTARWLGIAYLAFAVWLMFFPPWVASRYAQLNYPDAPARWRLGHHWRFAWPASWIFYAGDHGARIDSRLLVYEAATAFLCAALLFLVLSALHRPLRALVAGAKIEAALLRGRMRNWFWRGYSSR